MSIIKSLHQWLSECPELQKLSKDGHIDYTKDDTENYGISPGGETSIRKYIDGSSVNQYGFNIFARRYAPEDACRMGNIEFLENVSAWLEDKVTAGELPNLGEDAEAQSISCNFSAMTEVDQNGKTGLYQIPCELIYRKKRRAI